MKTAANEVHLLIGSDQKALKAFIADCDVVVLCLAADNPSCYHDTYLATAQALKNALKDKSKPTHILYTSSTSVYGDHGGAEVSETTPPFQQIQQVKSLLATEHELMTCATPKLHVAIFRLGEIYGPGRKISDRLHSLNGRKLPGDGLSITKSYSSK